MPAEARAVSSGSMGTMQNTISAHKSVKDKQKAAIEKLRQQNEQLKHELLLENKFSVRPGDAHAQALINRLQDEGDMLARQIVLEMRKTKMLDQQLSETHSVLGTTRSLMGGIYAAKEKAQTIQMKIKLLENRLEKAYVKYNQSVTHNKQLRDQINNLRRENLMFQSINSNLERELQKLKKDMAETIQLANVAFEAKEKAVAEMNVLKVQADKELQGFEEEWKHLTAIIEEDKRERERARAQELAMRERETQELLKMGTVAMDKGKKSKALGKGANYNKALEQNVAAEKVQMYTQAFEKIQAATNIEDIDHLVNTFITAEDQNYTLFNYVNEVNQEIEKLEDQITAIKAETDKYKSSGNALNRSQSLQLHGIEDQLTTAETQAELYRKRFEAATTTVGLMKTCVSDIFVKIGCDTPAVKELLGDDGVTDNNIMAYLGIMEQRTNELLQMHASRKLAEGGEVITESLIAQPLTQLSNRIVIEPPSATQEEEIEGVEPEPIDDERPLSRDHLNARVQKTLPRKIETAIKVRPPGTDTTTNKRSPDRRR